MEINSAATVLQSSGGAHAVRLSWSGCCAPARTRAGFALIVEFLPRQLTEAEVEKAVDRAIFDVGAQSVRDMGRVMGALKSRYTGRMDFGAVGPVVKQRICSPRPGQSAG